MSQTYKDINAAINIRNVPLTRNPKGKENWGYFPRYQLLMTKSIIIEQSIPLRARCGECQF